MIVFFVIGLYLMPILGFLFVVGMLRAIKKIVKNQPYTVEVFWTGLLFAIIVWDIVMVALMPSI